MEAKLAREVIDVTLPGRGMTPGHLHPVTKTMDRVVSLFAGLGFTLEEGLRLKMMSIILLR